MSSYSISDAATHATIVTYAWQRLRSTDPGNRRMLMDEATTSTSDTLYYYAGWQVVEERAASGGALQRQFADSRDSVLNTSRPLLRCNAANWYA